MSHVLRITRNLAVGGDLLTLTDAKAHLRVTSSSEDALISALINMSRSAVENYVGYWIGVYEVDAQFQPVEVLPTAAVVPETGEPISPAELQYTDELDAPQTAVLADIAFDPATREACFTLPELEIKPQTTFTIAYTTKRGEEGIIGDTFTQARLLIIGAGYINRDEGDVTTPGALWLLDNYRRNQP